VFRHELNYAAAEIADKEFLMMNKTFLLAAMLVVAMLMPTAGTPAWAQDAAGEMAPLAIKLPKPMFVGTPKDIRSPNLEKQTGKPRGPFMAPKDAVILSADKEATASDDWPIIGETELLTDSDKEGADGSFVEYGPGVQYVQVDLGESCELYAVIVWHYHAQARVYRDFIVKVADDEDFVTNVRTLFNNDHDNSAGLGMGKDKEYIETNGGKLVNGKKEKARYIRLYSNGNTTNDMNHYIEVEAWGKKAK
jgi:hypothetical protein